jgi:hypothetical protein
VRRLGRVIALLIIAGLVAESSLAQVGGGLPPMRRKAHISNQTPRQVQAASAFTRVPPPPTPPTGGQGGGGGSGGRPPP